MLFPGLCELKDVHWEGDCSAMQPISYASISGYLSEDKQRELTLLCKKVSNESAPLPEKKQLWDFVANEKRGF